MSRAGTIALWRELDFLMVKSTQMPDQSAYLLLLNTDLSSVEESTVHLFAQQ